MANQQNMVCVRVDCKCAYGPDFNFFPLGIEGIHRISKNDARARVGAYWTKRTSVCPGKLFYPFCLLENCCAEGVVEQVVETCENCRFAILKDCPLNRTDRISA